MNAMIAAMLVLLAGCTTASNTYGPDGRVAHSIRCDGIALSMGSCFEKAGALCGSAGYDVIGGGNERGAVASTSFATTTSNRSLIVSCKDGR
jgi:hypothetical protein